MAAAEPPPPPPPQTISRKTRVVVVVGPVGSGKTTLLNAIINRRPPEEAWAVLQNCVGETQLDQGSDGTSDCLRVQQLVGACACCVGSVPMRTTVAKLLKRPRPACLLIELSTLGQPDSVVAAIQRDMGNVAVMSLVVALVPPALHDQLWEGSEIYRTQLSQAELLLLLEDGDKTKEEAAVSGESLSTLPELSDKPLAVWRRAPPEAKDADLALALPDALMLPILNPSPC